MNSENSKTSQYICSYLTSSKKKPDSGRGEKSVALSNLCINC